MRSDLDFFNLPVLPGNGCSSQSVTALLVCSFCTIPDFSGWNRSHGRGGGYQLSKVYDVSGTSGVWPWISKASKDRAPTTCLGPGSWVLSQGWATLRGTDPLPTCSEFPCHSCGLLPLQGPWVSIPSTSSCRETKAAPHLSSPVLPVPFPGLSSSPACPLCRALRWDGVVSTETLMLCKQEQKDCFYFNPTSSEPTNSCQTRWAAKAPCFPAELSEQELRKL